MGKINQIPPTFTITNSQYILKNTLEEILFPKIKPYNQGYLRVSKLHSIWHAEYGNPRGIPVVVVHGGPGFGCSDTDMRYFNPKHYRIILFDQRRAKRSKPFAEMKENTTQNLISDMEKLRKHLKVTKWLIFGGSWGSALSILYGQAYPKSCLGFILRGIFLGREAEYLQLWYGMQDIFPEAWDEFINFLPTNERNDLIKSYYKRVMDPNPKTHMPAAYAFIKYDVTCSTLKHDPKRINKVLKDKITVLGLSRTFIHYCTKKFFLEENQILKNLTKVSHLPAIIIHGRYDIICRPKSAYELHKNWPKSQLIFVQDAGHSTIEPGIVKAFIEATNAMKKLKPA